MNRNSKRWIIIAAVLASSGAACNRKQAAKAEGGGMVSVVSMANPKTEPQLVSGFYSIEQNSWRWTAQKFSVTLRPPAGVANTGATLNLQLAVPDAVIGRLKSVSLSATVGGKSLAPETYTQSGTYTFTRDVPADALTGDAVKVDFALDKAIPPGTNGDVRELGVIVSAVGLTAKKIAN